MRDLAWKIFQLIHLSGTAGSLKAALFFSAIVHICSHLSLEIDMLKVVN